MNGKVLFFLILFIVSQPLMATEINEKLKIGIGIGTLYSGVGSNIALVTDDDMKYASVGCIAYSSDFGTSCGVGFGWVKTGLINDDNKHGLGLYLGIVGMEKQFDIAFNRKKNNVYGGGINYNYYLNGINKSGTAIGVGYLYGQGKEKDINSFLFQIGYQF